MNFVTELIYSINWRDLLICLLVFTPLEHIFPLHSKVGRSRRGWLTDATHFFLTGLLTRFGVLFVIFTSAEMAEALVPSGLRTWVSTLPLWLQVALATAIADLGGYLAHRAMHKVPTLWSFHAVHHSSEALDWVAAYRVHPVDQLIMKGASLMPIFLLGFSIDAVLVAAVIYQWHSLLVHSNIRLPLGPLNVLVAGPAFHHWHHANDHEARDKNFSAQLPIWDLIFGSFYLPRNMPDRYGVDEPVPESWAGQMTYPLRRKEEGIMGVAGGN